MRRPLAHASSCLRALSRMRCLFLSACALSHALSLPVCMRSLASSLHAPGTWPGLIGTTGRAEQGLMRCCLPARRYADADVYWRAPRKGAAPAPLPVTVCAASAPCRRGLCSSEDAGLRGRWKQA